MKYLPFALAPLTLAISLSAHAADDTNPLSEIVITASRSLTPITESLDAANVITREEIQRQQASSVADILMLATGISLPTTGGPLTNTGVFLRGFKSNQILVLIDGIRANDANNGQFDFSALRADDIERIEVLRGGYSSQYGSDAMGGVIQIFTRRHASNSVTLRAGSYGTLEERLNLGHQSSTQKFALSLSQLDMQGFSAGNKNYVESNGNYGFDFTTMSSFPIPPSPDRDGGRQRTLQLSGQQQLSSNATLDGSFLLKDQSTEFDDGNSDSNLSIAALKFSQTITDNYRHQLTLGQSRTLQKSQGEAMGFPFDVKFDTQRLHADWIHNVEHQTMGTTTAGISIANERAKASNVDQSLLNKAIFLINEKRIGNVSYRLSGRQETQEQWGTQSTGSIRAGYAFNTKIDGYIGYGKSFRAPTASELFDSTFASNNPDLAPETSRQRDIGLVWRHHKDHVIKLNIFRSDVENLIAFQGTKLANLKSAQLEGVEIEAHGQYGRLNYALNGLRARNRDTSTGDALVRRPTKQLSGDVSYQLHEALSIGTQVLSRGATPDLAFDQNFTAFNVKANGFAVFNAYAQWHATKKLDLGLRLDNLTDKTYELSRGYNTPGRSGYVTAQYKF